MAVSKVVFYGLFNVEKKSKKSGLKLESLDSLPEIDEGQMLVKTRLATICGTDIHSLLGRRQSVTPCILGHEAVVEVVKSRRSSSTFKIGDRVTFSIANSCLSCQMCKNGLPQKCIKLFKYGHSSIEDGTGMNGCYANYIVLRSGTHVVKVPDHVSDKMAAPVNCALATMVNATGYIDTQRAADKTVVIQGAGLLGIYGCALLREIGFGKIYCVDINQDRLKLVEKFGAVPVLAGSLEGERPKPNQVDAVIEVCGVPEVVKDGLNWLIPGGSYIFVGMVHPHSKLELTAEQIILKCLTLQGVHNYTPAHLEKALDFLSKTAEKYPYEELVGPPYPLKDFAEAVEVSKQQKYYRVAFEF